MAEQRSDQALTPDLSAFIRGHLPVAPVPGIPEIRLHKAVPSSGLARLAARDEGFGSPYWAHYWAGGLALARTVEYFRVPRDVLVICLGKSTYARCGIIVNVTPLEPGWEGHVTLEFSNTTPLPAKIYANEGACQFLFLQGNEPCETSYADRAGKYMGQRGVTLPKL